MVTSLCCMSHCCLSAPFAWCPVCVVQKEGDSPLHLAALSGNCAIAEGLLQRGATVDQPFVRVSQPILYCSQGLSSRLRTPTPPPSVDQVPGSKGWAVAWLGGVSCFACSLTSQLQHKAAPRCLGVVACAGVPWGATRAGDAHCAAPRSERGSRTVGEGACGVACGHGGPVCHIGGWCHGKWSARNKHCVCSTPCGHTRVSR